MSMPDTDVPVNEHHPKSPFTTDPLVLYVNAKNLSVDNDKENSDSANKTSDEGAETEVRQQNRPFSCDICGKTFKRRSHLNVHLFTHNDQKSYECNVCKKSFFHPYFLKQHEKLHNSEKIFSCDTCHMEFSVRRYYTRHLRTHKAKRYKCDACEFASEKLGGINEHVKGHGESYTRCEICNMHFCYETSISTHECYKSDIRPFGCNLCTRVFKTSKELDLHVAGKHNDERRFVCGECKKGFNYKKILDLHMETHIDETEKPYSCPKCSKKFHFEIHFKSHIKLHSRIPKKSYSKTRNSNSTSRANKNPDDSKYYAKIGYLNIEGPINLNQLVYYVPLKSTKYICDVCLRCFKNRYRFKTHYRIHTGEKPYECEVCHRRFTAGCDLKRHFRVHTGERNYPCPNCQRRYTRKSFLTTHLKKCHPPIPKIVEVHSEFQDSASSQG